MFIPFYGRLAGAGAGKPPNDPGTKPLHDHRELKSKLQEASKHIPRYLFRMWHPSSGGNSKLNSTEKVVPHAFHHGAGHATVYDMSLNDFTNNVTGHLQGSHAYASEFSSWSASPRFAFHYATSKRETAHIAIIDTEGLSKHNKNLIFHVPALQSISGLHVKSRGVDFGSFDWEYLAHGVVEGQHYKAVSFKQLCDNGLLEYLPNLECYVNAWCRQRFQLPKEVVPFSMQELRDLKKIAKPFGSDFKVAFTIALFCCVRRRSFGDAFEEHELTDIVEALDGRSSIPLDWSGSRSVVCDGIYDPRYEDNKQMVKVMRALSTHCWGKWARHRCMNEGTALVGDDSIDFLTAKLSSTVIDCDASDTQNRDSTISSLNGYAFGQSSSGAESSSGSHTDHDSGYGARDYRAHRKSHHPRFLPSGKLTDRS